MKSSSSIPAQTTPAGHTPGPVKSNLLEFDSITYLRRLAKALNELPDGFYFEGERYMRASVHAQGDNGTAPFTFKIRRPAREGESGDYFTYGMSPSCHDKFTDAYGRSVCASRRKK